MSSLRCFGQALPGLFLCLFCLSCLCAPSSAQGFTANFLGDYEDVSVMEVSGDYDALVDGQWNHEPRRAIAREFYRSHGDDYDFLVIFTNFDYLLPTTAAAAYFTPVQNRIQGIGLETFDYSPGYDPDGSGLDRLQGTIDMANLASHATDPVDPGFETTLKVLAHEMSHRWGAYVHFIDEEGRDSNALLGIDDAHWSFLLDSAGSSLYGNNWRDNGDGTFTSIQPELGQRDFSFGRIFSPLDLYLMGLVGPEDVPPLTLVESPGIERSQPPSVGETIVGAARTVTIEQVIAAEGERNPPAAESPRSWRVGYVYAVVPGSWAADLPQSKAEVRAIADIREAWAARVSILTDGAAVMQTDLPVAATPETNPGVSLPLFSPAVAPSVNAGVAWLVGQQQADGRWQDRAGTAARDTAEALIALRKFPVSAVSLETGMNWLTAAAPVNNDFLARQAMALNGSVFEPLLDKQNPDGGWGAVPGYLSNPLDTALALRALLAGGVAPGALPANAIDYLAGQQGPDGGWGAGTGASMLQPTVHALFALNAVRSHFSVEAELAAGLAWLTSRQNPDGGFGNSPGTVYDTALALLALKASGPAQEPVDQAAAFLLNGQADNGSWRESVFQTALALEALYAGQVQTDLLVSGAAITLEPGPVETVPAEVTVSVAVRNQGEAALTAVKVALYEGASASVPAVQEQWVDLPGNSSVVVAFPVRIAEAGRIVYTVAVDPDQLIDEAGEYNNFASREFYVGPPPPVIGFATDAASGSEALAAVDLTVALSHAWHEPVSVKFAAVSSGTAAAGSDYLLEPGTLVIPAGETRGTIVLTVLDDQLEEMDETIHVRLSDPVNASSGPDSLLYTILDDDILPVVSIRLPADGETYRDRTPPFSYTSNMPADQVAVFVDAEFVATGDVFSLGPLSAGPHTLRVEAANSNGVTTTEEVTFLVDDAGLPPDLVWQKDNANYAKFVAAADGGFYGNGRFVKFDQTWTRQWELDGSVSDFMLKDDKVYLLGQKADGNFYLQVYEPGGNLLWEKQSPVAWGRVVVDEAGNLIVAGSLVVDMKNKPSQTDMVVYKFDPYGRHLGDYQFGSLLDETLADLQVDHAGNIYVYGTTPGYVGTDVGGANIGGKDLFVAKIPASLEDVRIRQLGSSLDDVANELRIDSRGHVYLAATTTGSFDGIPSTYDMDAVLIRLDEQFEVAAVLQEHMINRSVELFVDDQDAVYLAGTYGEYRPNYQDVFTVKVIKYSAGGERQWTLDVFNQHYNQTVGDLFVDAAGGIYIGVGYLYPNYATGYWEGRNFLRKYTTGRAQASLPVLTVAPLADELGKTTMTLSGTRESGASVTVSADSLTQIGNVEYPTATTWTCEVSGLTAGEHLFILSATGSGGQTRALQVPHRVFPQRNYQQEWLHQYGSAGDDTGTALSLDGEGRLLVAGHTRGLWGTEQTRTSEDLLLLKTGADGHLAQPPWQMDVDSAGLADVSIDAATDGDGNVYLLWVNPLGGFVAKFDSSGNQVWRQAIDSKQQHYPTAITLDSAGNLYVCGYTYASLARQFFGGETDYFIVKYDSHGTRQWLRLSGEPDRLYANDIAVDANGLIWVAGRKLDRFSHGTPLLFKLDSSGFLLSETAVDPHDGDARAVWTSADGGVYVAGHADYMRGFDQDPFLIRFDNVPRRTWRTDLKQLRAARIEALHVKADGEVIVAGSRYSGGSSDPDGQLLLFDAAGQPVFSQSFATGSNETCTDIASGADGAIFVSGWTRGSLAAESRGGSDLFAARLQRLAGPRLEINPYASPTRSLSQLISGSVSDGALLAVSIESPAGSDLAVSAVTAGSDGAWQFTVSNLVPNLDNVLLITATDAVGTTSARLTITVDTLPPALEIDAVLSPTDQSDQLITGSVEEGAFLSIEENPPAIPESLPVVAGRWSYAASGLLEGENRFHFVAADAAGNSSFAAVTITYLPPAPLALAVAPTGILATDSTEIVLTIGNLRSAAETVVIEQRVDLDHDGAADSGEPVIRRLSVTDGLSQSNPNLTDDEDGAADGSIVANLDYHLVNDRYHAPAAYVFRASTAEQMAEASFRVSEVSQPQTIGGMVADAAGQPVRGAFVELVDAWGRVHGSAVADEAGSYLMNVVQPGEYFLRPGAEGSLYATAGAAPVDLSPGQVVSGLDLLMEVGPNQVTGRVVDSRSGGGLAGILVRAQNAGIIATSLTDAEGYYRLALTDGVFELAANAWSGDGPAAKGALAPVGPALTVAVDGDTSGNDILLAAADSLSAGRVVDSAAMPVAGVALQAVCTNDCGAAACATSDERGDFSLGVLSGQAWDIALLDDAAQPIGLVGTPVRDVLVGEDQPWAGSELVVYAVDAWVTGVMTETGGEPVAGIPVVVANQATGTRAVGRSATDGSYRLGIDAGNCEVLVLPGTKGFAAEPSRPVSIAPGETVQRDFALTRALANTISISSAVFTLRKNTLSVTATSAYPDAGLMLDGFGPMTFVKQLKGVYTWTFSGIVPDVPATVTVAGAEGSATTAVKVK